jgi:DNA-binding response OmpR family regulator
MRTARDRRRRAQPPKLRAGHVAVRRSAVDSRVAIRILIVEDDAPIAHLLTVELGRLGYVSRTAATAVEALALAKSWSPQLMLLDLGLPDRDGAGVLRDLRAQGDALPVICVTARDQQIDRIGGLRAGADDYIVKPFDVGELDARIRAVLRRADRGGTQELVFGTLRLASDEVRVFANDQLLALTPRELHVLRQLLRNAGRVVTKSQLTETLAALNEDIGDKTIEVYIHRIRNKIHGHGAEIVTVRGFGYLLRQSPVVRQAEAT